MPKKTKKSIAKKKVKASKKKVVKKIKSKTRKPIVKKVKASKKKIVEKELIFQTKPEWVKSALATKAQYQKKYSDSIKNNTN